LICLTFDEIGNRGSWKLKNCITFWPSQVVRSLTHNGPAIKGVCGAESNGGGECKLAMKKIPPEL
jgi:hypothetical protein